MFSLKTHKPDFSYYKRPNSASKSSLTTQRIPPLPIFRPNISSSAKLRARLCVRGDKNFSKLVASGPDTVQTLQSIGKLRGAKVAHSFEFDAYLCDDSGIKELGMVVNKVKKLTKKLILRIRRVGPGDKERLFKFAKVTFKRINNLTLEFPGTVDLCDEDMAIFGKALLRCSVKKVSLASINLPNVTEEGVGSIFGGISKLRKMEELKLVSFLKKTKSLENDDLTDECCDGCLASFKKLKKLHLSIATYTGWTSMSVEVDPFLEYIFRSLGESSLLETLHLRYGNEQITPGVLLALSDSIVSLKGMRNFSIEFCNSKITDAEIALLAYEMKKFTHLERVVFKVIQNPCASEACIIQFVRAILQLKNLKYFDIIFRRMNTTEDGIANLTNQLINLKGMNFEVSNQSFYAYRRPYHVEKEAKLLAIEGGN